MGTILTLSCRSSLLYRLESALTKKNMVSTTFYDIFSISISNAISVSRLQKLLADCSDTQWEQSKIACLGLITVQTIYGIDSMLSEGKT